MGKEQIPIEIFCSYAHADEQWFQKLEGHLSLLRHQHRITVWHDRLLLPGTDWAQDVDIHLEHASIILLLISPDFLKSDFCYGTVMQRALQLHEINKARVIPILVRSVDWQDAPFAHLHKLPTGTKALASRNDTEIALTEVATGIRHVIENLRLSTTNISPKALSDIWNIPYPRNDLFTGREEILARLREQLQTERASALSQTQAISGLGGIGKTQIAVEYAYRFRHEYQASLWAYAESQETLFASFIIFASLLHMPERESKDQMITVQAVKAWLQTHHNWLLILDNADEISLITSFLPPPLPGHVILTTRAAALGRLAQSIEVDTLSLELGASFVLKRAKLPTPTTDIEKGLQEDRTLAVRLTQALGGLPLALDQAGAYIDETRCGIADYLRHLEHHRAHLLKRRGEEVEKEDHPEPVATTWSLSFEQVQRRNPMAGDVLRLCAFLAPDAIPLEIILQGITYPETTREQATIDSFQMDEAILVLRKYSLLQRNPRTNTLSIHRLVQAVLQDAMTGQERIQWQMQVIRVLNIVFPEVIHEVWMQCERLIPHVLVCVANSIDRIKSQELVNVSRKAANYLYERTQYHDAESLYQRALHIQEQTLGNDHPDMTSLLQGLAKLYVGQGKYHDAESLYQRALHIQEHALESNHRVMTSLFHDLAILYKTQGKYNEAESLYLQALHVQEQIMESDHPERVALLHNLATLYMVQGRYGEAESLYQQALRSREQTLGSNHPDVASSLNKLASLYNIEGKYKAAEPLYRRALRIREQTLGSNHPSVASTFAGLATLYTKQGKYKAAKPLYQRALRIRKQTLDSDHPDVAFSFTGLATFYADQGKFEQAELLYLQALHILEQGLGPNHPDVAFPLNGMAIVYAKQAKYEQAELLYQRALHILEQTFGPHHTRVAYPLHGLASLYAEQEEYEQAEPLYQRALHIWEQTLGPDHSQLANPLNNLAIIYKAQGNYEAAEVHYLRALHIWEQTLGPNHPQIASLLNNLALLYTEQEKYEKAESLYLRALRIQEQKFGSRHPFTHETVRLYISLLHILKRTDDIGHLEARFFPSSPDT